MKQFKHICTILIFFMLPMFTILFSNKVSAANRHFPRQLLNKPTEQAPRIDENVKKAKIIYNASGKEVSGLVVYPDSRTDNVFPSVLFIQTIDETPQDQLARMSSLAQGGYLVMCVPWENSADVEEAFQQMLKLNIVDRSRVGVIGAHQGATEAIIMAVKWSDIIKTVVSIAGKPDYEHPSGDPGVFLQARILLIHGEADTQIPSNVAQYFYYYLIDKEKNADIILMSNSRHYFNDAEWSQIMTDVKRFLENNLKNPPKEEKSGR